MNDFTPKEIKKASLYLQEKLETSVQQMSVDKEEKKEALKSSKLKQFVSSIFKR